MQHVESTRPACLLPTIEESVRQMVAHEHAIVSDFINQYGNLGIDHIQLF